MKITLKNVSNYYRGEFVAVYEETREYDIKIIENKVYFNSEIVGEIKEEDLKRLKEEKAEMKVLGYAAKYNEYLNEEDEYMIKEIKDEHEIHIFI